MGEFLEALAQPGFRHPRTGRLYSSYIDVPAFIDHNLMTVLFKNVDGLRLSAYFYKNRGGPLVAGPVWDFDRSSGTPFDADFSRHPAARPSRASGPSATAPTRCSGGSGGSSSAEPTFKAAHARRWAELTRGPFSLESLHRLIDAFAAQLAEAQAPPLRALVRSAPQPAAPTPARSSSLKDWFAARIPWVTRPAPDRRRGQSTGS